MQQKIENRDGLQRPMGNRWRAALKALAMPATRVHNYRNLHRVMFYDVMCQLDCEDCE